MATAKKENPITLISEQLDRIDGKIDALTDRYHELDRSMAVLAERHTQAVDVTAVVKMIDDHLSKCPAAAMSKATKDGEIMISTKDPLARILLIIVSIAAAAISGSQILMP